MTLICNNLTFNTETGEATYAGKSVFFKKGYKDYNCLLALMKNKNEVIAYQDLISLCLNPIKKIVFDVAANEKLIKIEKKRLKEIIDVLKRKLRIPREMIQSEKFIGYKIVE